MKTEIIINEYLENQDIVAISKRQYHSNLKLFFMWIEDEGLEFNQITAADIIKYKQHLINKSHTQLTIANHLVSVRLFFKWAEENGYGKDVTTRIRIKKNYNTFRKKSLTPIQAKKFIEQFDTSTIKGKRDYAIANLMLRNGLREIEVVRMNLEDIINHDGNRAVLLQRKGKMGKESMIPLSIKAWEAIEDYYTEIDKFAPDQPLFISFAHNSFGKRISTTYISTMIKEKMIASGLIGKYYTAHSLRHTTASLLIANGYSEYDVKTFMGHANFQTTQIYTRQREQEMIFTHKLINHCDAVI